MDASLIAFTLFLGLLWFLIYWILGGVFFALVAIMRLGRVRKLRFSCMFTVWSFLCALGSAWFGVFTVNDAIAQCVAHSDTSTEMVSAVFGCGFVSVLGFFLVGALLLVGGGFLIMALSKSKTKPWFDLELDIEDEEPERKIGTGYFDGE
jgi:signal transduction histidine kinase